MVKFKAFLFEVVQFIPVITLASSFIVTGGVDLSRAATLFVLSGIGAFVITAALIIGKVPLNPVLLGTKIWLCAGALSFGVPVTALAGVLAKAQAAGLFACVLGVSVPLTIFSPTGFIGMSYPEPKTVRKLSLLLMVAAAIVFVWSIIMVDNIRLGGGLPFILLNVTRRMIMRRHRPMENRTSPTPGGSVG
ncbi:MAG: hypothetical protein JW863_04490 [Chitinispirillaceae bacterium]|nr:hypothetical protein [Chitinispirillaceae bacterium]